MTHSSTRTLRGLTVAAVGIMTAHTLLLSPAMATTADDHGKEVARLNPRALISHAGGLTLIDTVTGKTLQETPRKAFLRLNEAGDGRHVMVTDGDRFLVYDTGIQAHPHGDHTHYFVSKPHLTSVSYDAPHAGHVVVHRGKTTLYADGTGEMWTYATDQIAEPDAEAEHFAAPEAHHGVAIKLADGNTLHTLGTEEERSGVRVINPTGEVIAETQACPGVHGEAAAQPNKGHDIVAIGCEDGPVIWNGRAFRKVKVKDDYARTGNLKGTDNSPVLLGDYKVDPDAAPERPTRISLIDSRTTKLRLVDLKSAYWFRSLARNDKNGDAVVLTYNGDLTVVDEHRGTITARIPTIKPWREHKDWQQPGPAVQVVDGIAYVTDAARDELVVVDLSRGRVQQRHTLPHTPVELAITTG